MKLASAVSETAERADAGVLSVVMLVSFLLWSAQSLWLWQCSISCRGFLSPQFLGFQFWVDLFRNYLALNKTKYSVLNSMYPVRNNLVIKHNKSIRSWSVPLSETTQRLNGTSIHSWTVLLQRQLAVRRIFGSELDLVRDNLVLKYSVLNCTFSETTRCLNRTSI